MTNKPPDPAQLLKQLQTDEALKHQPVAPSELPPALMALRMWQSERLKQTYNDLLEDKQFRPACEFFLSDIYAPRDFAQRDHDLERIQHSVEHIAPPQVTNMLAQLVELNRLTNVLDEKLTGALGDVVVEPITPQRYADAYRRCDNYAERLRQIELIGQVITQVGGWAHLFIVGMALKIVRGPAHQAGWVELYDFLERGYTAFRQMRDVPKFVTIVETRERRILDRIYAGQPDPFASEDMPPT